MDKEDWIMQIGLWVIFILCVWIFWKYAPDDVWKPWVGVCWAIALGAFFR